MLREKKNLQVKKNFKLAASANKSFYKSLNFAFSWSVLIGTMDQKSPNLVFVFMSHVQATLMYVS